MVRAEIRKAAVNRQTAVTTRELPSFGQLKHAGNSTDLGTDPQYQRGARRRSPSWTTTISEELAGRHILEVARSLHNEPAGSLTIDAFAASKVQ